MTDQPTGMRSGLDYSHPLHRASVVVEELKYGAVSDKNVLTTVTGDQMIAELKTLIEQAALEGVDADTLFIDSRYYGENFRRMFGSMVPTQIAWSIFLDGLMHGIALAANIQPEDPRVPKP